VKRRAFIAALASAAAWPLVVRAQQPIPVVSFLQFGAIRADLTEGRNKALLIGMSQAGFDNGRNVIVDPIPVPNLDQLPTAVAAQVQRKVAVIVGTLDIAMAAKAATSTIPIVFATVDDPVKAGVVSSYSRPGGNVTGVRVRAGDEPAKLLELLHELLPRAATIGVLVYRGGPGTAQDVASVEAAAQLIGLHCTITPASSEIELDAAFADFARSKVDAVLINNHRYFDLRREQIIALATRYRLPAVSLPREFAVAGGLASFGSDLNEGIKQAGIYIGRILKGEDPGDLPVMQPTKFQLVINLKMAKKLDFDIPPQLLARADEVIE
jgi:putative ABC transport system substrate-binding protein